MPELSDRLNREGTIVLETIEPGDGRRRVWQFDSPRETLEARDAASLDRLLRWIDAEADAGRFAVGYVAYEAGHALLPTGGLPAHTPDAPLAWFATYGAPREIPNDLAAAFDDGGTYRLHAPDFDYSRRSYAEAFRALKHHVFEGDVYQINLTGRFSFAFEGSIPTLYAALVRRQRNTLGAYLHAGDRVLLSRSPELFFLRDGDHIVTRPMKGTANRGATVDADEAQRVALAADPKSRAENLMIVDLLRNDLSVVCEPGSVRVPALFSTEVHETLIQMTSTVEGRLRPGVSTSEVIRALFPCGSVTGAPKIRAMQIIRALERSPRGPYCGAIGWVGPGRRAVFNVAIRTAEIETRSGTGRLGVGSGVVWDSDADAEFDECLLKSRFFFGERGEDGMSDPTGFDLIETMKWRGGVSLLPLHLKRLEDSAATLGFDYDEIRVRAAIDDATRALDEASHRVRVKLSREGQARVEVGHLVEESPRPWRLAVAAQRVASADPMRRHKTSRRERLERHREEAVRSGADEVVFLNERDEICEGARSNIILRRDGALFTPPVSSGLLPGVYRAFLLQTRTDLFERVLTLADLVAADEIFVCNAVLGLREAYLQRDAGGRVLVVHVDKETEPDSRRAVQSEESSIQHHP